MKIAGEMVSLPYVEEVVLRGFGSDEAVNVAVEAQEYDGGATIVLFTTDRTLSLV